MSELLFNIDKASSSSLFGGLFDNKCGTIQYLVFKKEEHDYSRITMHSVCKNFEKRILAFFTDFENGLYLLYIF